MFDMLGNIFKNLISKPATRNYPFSTREMGKNTRGHISGIDPDACIYCGICQRKCPSDAIKVDKANKVWELETFKCIICGECVTSCPKKCINMENFHATASTNKDVIVCKATRKETTPDTDVSIDASIDANIDANIDTGTKTGLGSGSGSGISKKVSVNA